jgi:hypothetical protein
MCDIKNCFLMHFFFIKNAGWVIVKHLPTIISLIFLAFTLWTE